MKLQTKLLDLDKSNIHYQLSTQKLKQIILESGNGEQTSMDGAIAIKTGKFTGRSPENRFIVEDDITSSSVWWGDINIPFDSNHFDSLLKKMGSYLEGKQLYVHDAKVCADPDYGVRVRTICELPYSALFVNNMFISLSEEELKKNQEEWVIIVAPNFEADPNTDHTPNANFSIINFSKKAILIGGSAYTGEIKKGIFTVLNFLMPIDHNILPMHCSVNEGSDGNCSLFFGLSGTGKTTLSSDPKRMFIGDDEHGWVKGNKVFNFEGGCYAKIIDLKEEKEPDIYHAIRGDALLENVILDNEKNVLFSDASITENTRVSYPVEHVNNAKIPSIGGNVNHVFFLTADAYGVLPPISKLSKEQAAYYFISGYTSKVAGTEVGVVDPIPTFSACFGEAFMPLHPSDYASRLMDKVKAYNTKVWLINTGWAGGPFGIGDRIKLHYTRAMIESAFNNELENVKYKMHSEFGLMIPESCPNVPDVLLDPVKTWKDPKEYKEKAQKLIEAFRNNFKKYESKAGLNFLVNQL